MRIRFITLIMVLGIVLAGVFGSEQQPSSGQQQFPASAREPACGCFCGFKPPYPPVPPVAYTVFENKNCAGILASDACEEYLANLPKDKLESICQKVK